MCGSCPFWMVLDCVLSEFLKICLLLPPVLILLALYFLLPCPSQDLAKRLLLGKSASMDSEKQLVARLKAECGSAFTSKLVSEHCGCGRFEHSELNSDVLHSFVRGTGMWGAT